MNKSANAKGKMTSMLELPRELYLMICDYLSPRDLARLAEVTQDHYLATQQPLFRAIKITAFGNLVKLVHTITKPPIVSTVSKKQRLRWQSLSDTQLREREIRQLGIVLYHACRDAAKVTGAVLSRCIGAVSRCNNGPKISINLHGSWYHLLRQLQSVPLPDVQVITMYLGQHEQEPSSAQRNPCMHVDLGFELWDLCFEGSNFPDLQQVSINTLHVSLKDLPTTLNKGASISDDLYRAAHGHGSEPTSFLPFFGLRNMTTI
ncbi:hypothetical protein DOTSEDRAFT_28137 [Dothistroma septosporum NZE10]|uniref:F-box domain-containing protein n=1 Tax=Dothistroma septosporum (strain NZE10 / CBS 128990) TaxID=675120 RepID=N1PD38_DOTSN|nr:hypothetical protein DOTSEDRAFT_28137 [Dothistroma septosporum NZE10]